jgi:hypothetical protein
VVGLGHAGKKQWDPISYKAIHSPHKYQIHKKIEKPPIPKKSAAHKNLMNSSNLKLNLKTIRPQKIAARKNSPKPPMPYWNFWKVVFAGWLIRYPKTFMKLIGLPIGFILVMIYNASR